MASANSQQIASVDHDVMAPLVFAGATAVPTHSISQVDAAAVAQSFGITQRWLTALPGLYKKSGVQRRGSVLLKQASGDPAMRQSFYSQANENSPFGPTTAQRMRAYRDYAAPLLASACSQTLQLSSIAQRRVTHLVTVSCTGFCAPGIDHELIETLDLSPNIERTHVGFMGCHGLINGLRIAGAIAKSDSDALVLVGAVELCSIHQQFSEDPQQLVANAIFADGAASFLVAASSEVSVASSAPFETWNLHSSFSYKIPKSADLMGWEIGDHGFSMSLSPEVPRVVESVLREAIVGWLAEMDLDLSDIDAWAVHPGGPRIIDAVETALSLSPDMLSSSRTILRNYGNMSSPTVAFVLDDCCRVNPATKTCIVLGFGPGLSVEALLLKRLS